MKHKSKIDNLYFPIRYNLSDFKKNQILIIYRKKNELIGWSQIDPDFDLLIEAGKLSIKELP